MFTEHSKPLHNIWQQLKWKVKLHEGKMLVLLIIQIAFILLFESSASVTTFGLIGVDLRLFQSNLNSYAVAAGLFIFILTLYVGTKSSVAENFTIPTTRTYANISNVLYLLCVSAMTTIISLSSFYIGIFITLFGQEDTIVLNSSELFSLGHTIGFFCWLLYVSGAAFILAGLFQIRNWLGVLAVVVGWMGYLTFYPQIEQVALFMIQGSVWLFNMKIVLVACVLFVLGHLLTAKLEVRS